MQEYRVKNGYTLDKLARKLKITKQYLWDIEDGRRTLSYKMAFQISEILGASPDEIFLEDNKRK